VRAGPQPIVHPEGGDQALRASLGPNNTHCFYRLRPGAENRGLRFPELWEPADDNAYGRFDKCGHARVSPTESVKKKPPQFGKPVVPRSISIVRTSGFPIFARTMTRGAALQGPPLVGMRQSPFLCDRGLGCRLRPDKQSAQRGKSAGFEGLLCFADHVGHATNWALNATMGFAASMTPQTEPTIVMHSGSDRGAFGYETRSEGDEAPPEAMNTSAEAPFSYSSAFVLAAPRCRPRLEGLWCPRGGTNRISPYECDAN